MTDEAQELWERAGDALDSACRLLPHHPDNAAVMAYYAAFNAVSALFALEGRSFSRHQAVEAAVHRDLAKSGRIAPDIAASFTDLMRLRLVGSYGVTRHVEREEAEQAINDARAILEAVRRLGSEPFPELPANADES